MGGEIILTIVITLKKIFCYFVVTIILQISFFTTYPDACLSDINGAFIYFSFVYPIYILSRLNLL